MGLRTQNLEGAGTQLRKKMAKTMIPITTCRTSPPSLPLSFSPFFPFMGSEIFIGCSGQKGFTEVGLQSDLKDSHNTTFQSQQGWDQCGNIVFLAFYKLPFQSSFFPSVSMNNSDWLFLVVIFALRFTYISKYI